jgi:hypothetical protein
MRYGFISGPLPFDCTPIDLALYKVLAAIIDRLIDVLAVNAGDETISERVPDEGTMPSR